jgi:hypothetical protein
MLHIVAVPMFSAALLISNTTRGHVDGPNSVRSHLIQNPGAERGQGLQKLE